MERSFGIWHTKCFPKATPPTQEEIEDLCKKLGIDSPINAVGRVMNSKPNKNSTSVDVPIEFQMFNATKVVTYSKFSAVQLNDGFTVHLRPSKPIAKLVSWDKSDHDNCHRMELKCVDNAWIIYWNLFILLRSMKVCPIKRFKIQNAAYDSGFY